MDNDKGNLNKSALPETFSMMKIQKDDIVFIF